MNRVAIVAVVAFGAAVAASGALVAANMHQHMRAFAAANHACIAQIPRMKTTSAYEERLIRCLQKKGVIDKNATVTFSITRSTSDRTGSSWRSYTKSITVKTQSGATARHT